MTKKQEEIVGDWYWDQTGRHRQRFWNGEEGSWTAFVTTADANVGCAGPGRVFFWAGRNANCVMISPSPTTSATSSSGLSAISA